MGDFKLLFIGLLVEMAPFAALAALVSFLVGTFIPEDRLRGFFARRPVAGVLLAAGAGVVIPVCECGVVPLVRRLMDRGVPASVALTFMLASPSLNLIVIASTSVAFATRPAIIALRFGIAAFLVIVFGMYFLVLERRGRLTNTAPEATREHGRGCGCCAHEVPGGAGTAQRARAQLDHALEDFLHTMVYLTIAAAATALIQTALPRDWLAAAGSRGFVAIPVMMLFAFITSTCSDSDGFIASAMLRFPPSSQLAYMLLGPVADLKLVILHAALLPRGARRVLWIGWPLAVAAITFAIHIFR